MSENAKKEEDSMKAKEESSSSSDSDDSSSDSDNDSDSSDSDDNLVADGTRFKVRVTELNAQLTCSICGGYFRDASTLSECQHTFCKSCILRLFSQGVSNCPEQNCGISLRYVVFRCPCLYKPFGVLPRLSQRSLRKCVGQNQFRN